MHDGALLALRVGDLVLVPGCASQLCEWFWASVFPVCHQMGMDDVIALEVTVQGVWSRLAIPSLFYTAFQPLPL